MVKVIPYLVVPNGKKAIELYENVFGAEEVSRMPFTPEVGASMNLPEDFDYENSTMHGEINIDGEIIYLADQPATFADNMNNKIDVLLALDSKEQIETFYNDAKKHGFTVSNELEKTFWGAWFARVVDPYGIGWQMNYQIEQQ